MKQNTSREYLYIVDSDERGEFRAHVEDKKTGKIAFEFCTDIEGDLWLIDFGYMKNIEDVSGLESYLKVNKLIEQESSIVK